MDRNGSGKGNKNGNGNRNASKMTQKKLENFLPAEAKDLEDYEQESSLYQFINKEDLDEDSDV